MERVGLSGPAEGDAFGEALLARSGGGASPIVYERDDGYVDVDTSDYFAEPDGSEAWQWLRERLGGRVLDIGAGAGRAALALQRAGVDVVALDVSPGAAEVCRQRGVRHTFLGTVAELAATGPRPFDSFLCLGNNLGLLGSPAAAPAWFGQLGALGAPGCRLVGTSVDPYKTDNPAHLAYHERNRAAGRLVGQLRLRTRYQQLATPWFELLWASPGELSALAGESGWELGDVRPGPVYCAELRPRRPLS